MFIVGNNKFGISSSSTIYELIVIHILGYQAEMDVNFLIDCSAKPGYSFNHIMSNFPRCLLCKLFLILVEYLCIDTQTNLVVENICPYLMIRTSGRQSL